jgi:hypothetical protein
MFKAMIFGFLAGVVASQTVQAWASDATASANTELGVLLYVDAYEKLAAALR